MTKKIAFELTDRNKLLGSITVKLRYSDIQTETVQATIRYTAADHVLLSKAKELFVKVYKRRQLVGYLVFTLVILQVAITRIVFFYYFGFSKEK